MIANPCLEIQTSEAPRPAVPPWFAEVTIIVQYLAPCGLLDAFGHQVRLLRGRFGRYEPIDFLALLLGYAISGERTLEAFCARVAPFRSAFMALFERRYCPHRARALVAFWQMWIVLASKPSVPSFNSSVSLLDGLPRPSEESSIGKGVASSSLM
jgi:hypothetical protein